MADRPAGGQMAGLPVDVLESKLYRPMTRAGVVPRPDLVARLRAARDVPVVAVVAPAGYGKTTLLTLWAQADDRPAAWVSLDRHDNDPIVLLTHLAVALDRVSPLDPATTDALRSAGVSVPGTLVPRLASVLAALPSPLLLVVDDVHHLRAGASLDALVTLADHVRDGSQIAVAGRGMPVPLARRRGQRGVLEIGTADLAFTTDGARSLLLAAGADLPDAEVARLARRTEGWAAGLYLAALSRGGTRDGAGRVDAVGDRLVADYLQAELVSGLSPSELEFLTRTAVLDRLSGPLCDAVLHRTGSAAELERLQQGNLFLVPLDGEGRWYRCHPLVRDLLRSRLDADGRRELLGRAGAWYEEEGQLETALHHAQAAADVDRVARIATALTQRMYASGRLDTLMDWFGWVDERDGLERHPAITAQAAYACALRGQPAAADRWADRAERAASRLGAMTAPSSTEQEAWLFPIWLTSTRALLCRNGVEQMREGVEEGAQRLPGAGSAADTEYPTRLFLSGVAHHLLGDGDTALARLADAAELTDEARRAPLASVTSAYRGLVHLDRRDWAEAGAFADRALEIARRGHAEFHVTAVLGVALAARMAVHRGEPTVARARLAEAQRLRPLLSHAIPWFAVETQLQMAEVAMGLGDPGGAHQFLRDAESVLRRRPDLGTLGKRTDELRGRVDALRASGTASSTLTAAELRLLPLLLTHLTVADIADRHFVSRHTVKAQLWSMYRKLGVHTRGDAVIRARELGLLET
jgi:LuxR family maltose regulon positive regulatory protein